MNWQAFSNHPSANCVTTVTGYAAAKKKTHHRQSNLEKSPGSTDFSPLFAVSAANKMAAPDSLD